MTSFTKGCISAAVSLALLACAGDTPPPEPGTPDAATVQPGTPDAGTVQPGAPDAGAPAEKLYPQGPYGTTIGSVIKNYEWQGYLDTVADADGDPFNEAPHGVDLADFYTGNDPSSRLLLVILSAGWCGPCQEEASTMPPITSMWWPKGIRFVTLMWQNPDGSNGTTDYSKTWGAQFHLNTPVVADPDSPEANDFGVEGIPYFILVDTKTMKIVDFPQVSIGDMQDVFGQYAH
jgi:hypothetical protein